MSAQQAQSNTVNATGIKQQPAVQATGTLIVNCRSSSSPLTINAGTVFTGNDGMQVATNVTTTINGSSGGCGTTISARAVTADTSGNIVAHDWTTTR
ncbi:MAG: baseplate J/gp47 family protein [Ktedonobacteraceae bacterium]|nr:baseplate J/gp47 family protein [Ktedonobacteraceae bacterium]